MQETQHKHHKSLPSLSFSIHSADQSSHSNQSSPRTSSHFRPMDVTKRWDDTPFEMELAEDDFIKKPPSMFRFHLPKLKKTFSRSNMFKRIYHWFS
ncbi:hypothetical protein BY458DRAFT_521626 [Sporodiniella umbellata]|nr:hypothetical protein BY458DRAFT_521626 [Sporodiniella umbellata]